MRNEDRDRELSDAELLELRGGISRVAGALMRAWWLGMVSARDSDERELFERICATVGNPAEQRVEDEKTPLSIRIDAPDSASADFDDDGLALISDVEYLAVFDALLRRYRLLSEAYTRGMITASSVDQKRQFAELRELLN
jgi:hypothetical protein